MPDAYTIRIYVPDGDPNGLRLVDRMNWTGRGIAFPRQALGSVTARPEFQGPGIYILKGHNDADDDDDLPLLYIGETENLKTRLEQHASQKPFWNEAVVFASTNNGLHKAHVKWLEQQLIARAKSIGQCHLQNGLEPTEPQLPEFERADTEAFLAEALRILPLLNIHCFQRARVIARPSEQAAATSETPESAAQDAPEDTLIVPAKREGFERAFLGENAWYAVRISGGKIPDIKYIAAYQTQPVSAVTHWATVDSIEPYGDTGKYRLNFQGAAQAFDRPIPFGKAKSGSMQGSRYTTLDALRKAKDLQALFKKG